MYPRYLQSLPLDKRKTLQLVNVVSLSIKSRQTTRGGTQWLGTIVSSSGKKLVDIPITDPIFVKKIESGYQSNGNYLITMSLGMPYKPDNWDGDEAPCWKLIAGVIELSKTQVANRRNEVKPENLLNIEASNLKLSLYKVGNLNASSPMISVPENQNLIALSNDRDLVLVKCWNTQTYTKYACDVELINLPIYSRVFEVNRVNELFFSPDGQLLGVLNLEKGEVECWNIVSNQLLYKFTDSDLANLITVYEGDEEEGISDTVVTTTYIIFFSSEKNIIVCSDFGIKTWKYGKLLYSIPQYRVTSDDMTREMKEVIAFNNDRDIFAFTDNKSQITSLINLKSGQLITTLKNDSSEIYQATLSHDASLLVLLEGNETLKLYNLSSNKYLKSLSILKGYEILDVQISPDLNHIAVISAKSGNEMDYAISKMLAANDKASDRKERKEVDLIRGEYGVKILNIKTGEVDAFIDYSDKIRSPFLVNMQISNILFSNDGKLLFVQRKDGWVTPYWVEVFHLSHQRKSI